MAKGVPFGGRSSVLRAVMETLDIRRLLSSSVGTETVGEHDHDHEAGPIIPFEINVTSPKTVSLTKPGSFLTKPRKGDPAKLAVSYLSANSSKLGTTRTAVLGSEITDRYTDDNTGLTHIYLRQMFNGLPVINSVGNASVDSSGRLLTAAGSFVRPGTVTKSMAREVASPKLSAEQAVTEVAERLGVELEGSVQQAPSVGKTLRVSAPGLQEEPVETNLVYVARGQSKVELAWRMVVELENGEHWYELAVSASSGEVIFATNYVSHASYTVFALPAEAPNDGTRSVVTDQHDTLASPFGWHDTNGVMGPEFTITRGNNVHAYLDRDNNNATDATTFDGGAGLNFNPGLDLTQAPTVLVNQQAALTNLFYLNNRIHDLTYRYGFTEVAGNFQTNNYGRGGAGNDAVNAEAQDGGGTNNANFATPADGTAPRMQMYLWTQTSPQRDGDLDGLIVIHEYTHGISNRLSGGPSNASALNAVQSGGMGEGWSDFFSLMLTQKPTDTATTTIGVGTYSLGQTIAGVGIRRFPYSTDMAVSPLTIGSYNSTQAVHRTGEVWCNALWDLNWALIGQYGATTDLGAGYTGPASGGSALTLQLVMDGMKLQPANPTLFQARDAILQADLNLTGGANQNLIWATFARRGFGFSASTGGSSSTSLVEAFDTPSPFPAVRATSLVQTSLVPIDGISVTFTRAINPSSFSVADDVLSLTGPGGVNLKPKVSSVVWSGGNTTVTLKFGTQSAVGAYTLSLSPNILSADTGLPIDQNADGSGAGAGDGPVVVVNYNPYVGPDASGYSAGATTFENIDLVAGAPGVVDTGLSADDSATGIPLGSSQFNFYGTTYTGSQLFANTNGLLTFTSSTTAYSNTDLATSPTQPSIAVMWDDWMTNQTTADRLLYRFDDLTADGVADRLVVEWSEVTNYDFRSSPATFQAILELNTGSRPGNITFNYPDLDVGNVGGSNGASATVGIKAAGTAGGNRLLVGQNNGNNGLIGNGKAIRFGLDVAPPQVTGSTVSGRLPVVDMTLSEAIVQPSVNQLILTNRLTQAVVPTPAAAVVISEGGTEMSYSVGSKLPDGVYRLTLPAGSLADRNGNRTLLDTAVDFQIGAGGNTTRPLAGSAARFAGGSGTGDTSGSAAVVSTGSSTAFVSTSSVRYSTKIGSGFFFLSWGGGWGGDRPLFSQEPVGPRPLAG